MLSHRCAPQLLDHHPGGMENLPRARDPVVWVGVLCPRPGKYTIADTPVRL